MAKSMGVSWVEVVETWRRVRVESRRVEQVAAEGGLTVKEVERRVRRIDAWLARKAVDGADVAGEGADAAGEPAVAIRRLMHALRLAWMAQKIRESLANSRIQVTRRQVVRERGDGREEKVTWNVQQRETLSRQEREMLRKADEWQAQAEECLSSVTFLQSPVGERSSEAGEH